MIFLTPEPQLNLSAALPRSLSDNRKRQICKWTQQLCCECTHSVDEETGQEAAGGGGGGGDGTG